MLNKTELNAAAKIMQALAHPLRLAVMQSLIAKEKTVSELYEELESSQSMMSQQIRILETQGLLLTRKDGTVKYCSIRNTDFLNLFHCMENHLEQYFKL